MIVLHFQGVPLPHYPAFLLCGVSLLHLGLVVAPLTLSQGWQRWDPTPNSKQLTAFPAASAPTGNLPLIASQAGRLLACDCIPSACLAPWVPTLSFHRGLR